MNPFRLMAWGMASSSVWLSGLLSSEGGSTPQRNESVELLGADPSSERVNFLVPKSMQTGVEWRERVPLGGGQVLHLERKDMLLDPVTTEHSVAGNLSQLLHASAHSLGLPRNPLSVVVVNVSCMQADAEKGRLGGFLCSGFRKILSEWESIGVRIEDRCLCMSLPSQGPVDLESKLGKLLGELDAESLRDGELVAFPVVIVLWPESEVAVFKANLTSRVFEKQRGVFVVNVSNSPATPREQRDAVRRMAQAHDWYYDEVGSERDGNGSLVKHWGLQGSHLAEAIHAYLSDYSIVSLHPRTASPSSSRRFVLRQGGSEQEFYVALSPRGQGILQKSALELFKTELHGETLRAYGRLSAWLPAFDAEYQSQAHDLMADYLLSKGMGARRLSSREGLPTSASASPKQDSSLGQRGVPSTAGIMPRP